MKKFLNLLKGQGRQLEELVGDDDEDLEDIINQTIGRHSADGGYDEETSGPNNSPDCSEQEVIDESTAALLGDDADEQPDCIDDDAIENCEIPVPSHFSREDRQDISQLDAMAERERQLRRAVLDERKRELSLSLRLFGVLVRDSRKRGITTRGRATIERHKRTQVCGVRSYQQHRLALERLGMTDRDITDYPTLTWEQLVQHRADGVTKPQPLGSGKHDVRGPLLPWLMMDLSGVDGSADNDKEALIKSLSTDGT